MSGTPRRVLALTAVAALAFVGTAAARARGQASSQESVTARADSAAWALRAARASGAPDLAPLTFALAEERYASALLEARRQELRPGWLRRGGAASSALDSATVVARRAEGLAGALKDRDRDAGRSAVEAARSALAALDGVEGRVWLAPAVRQRLQRARQLAEDGATLLAADLPRVALERARASEGDARAVTEELGLATGRFADAEQVARWRSWVEETVRWSDQKGRPAIVVDKDEHVLVLYENGRPARSYHAELGWNNVGDKRVQGDGATPEGRYFITEKRSGSRTRYHRALMLDYPNRDDRAALDALERSGSVPRGTQPGSLIEIHGEGGRGSDWTDGCVALTNAEMDHLFARVAVGTPVTIVGSRTGAGVFSQIARRIRTDR